MIDRKPIAYDPEWQEKYLDMIATPEKALSYLKPGHHVFIGTGCGEPVELVKAMTARSGHLSGVEIIHLLTKGEAPYAARKYADCFQVNTFFVGRNIREHIQAGLGDYTPMLLSDIPKILIFFNDIDV